MTFFNPVRIIKFIHIFWAFLRWQNILFSFCDIFQACKSWNPYIDKIFEACKKLIHVFELFKSPKKINSCFLRFLAWKNYLHNFWAFLILQTENKFIFLKSLQTWNSCLFSFSKPAENCNHAFYLFLGCKKWNSCFLSCFKLETIQFIFFERF